MCRSCQAATPARGAIAPVIAASRGSRRRMNRHNGIFRDDPNIFRSRAAVRFGRAHARCQRSPGYLDHQPRLARCPPSRGRHAPAGKVSPMLESLVMSDRNKSGQPTAPCSASTWAEAAPGMTVLGDHDRAFYSDTQSDRAVHIFRMPYCKNQRAPVPSPHSNSRGRRNCFRSARLDVGITRRLGFLYLRDELRSAPQPVRRRVLWA